VIAVLGAALAAAIAAAVLIPLVGAQPIRSSLSIIETGTGTEAITEPDPQPSVAASIAPSASPGTGLKVIDYSRAPGGFPADPAPQSTEPLTEGAHPTRTIPAYDAPGGRALAYLAPTISGVPLTTPIVEHRGDWVAVLLPSANRTIAWLAPGGWERVTLRDQLVVDRSSHQLSWYRSGALQQAWTVTLGAPASPTPLGRTFMLGRSALPGKVYAGIDVMALGNLPDDPNAVASGLRGAHVGIHSWYTTDSFGKSVSNGCVRVPQAGQRLLLTEITPGTEVVVIN
jgi:hypothetical protein